MPCRDYNDDHINSRRIDGELDMMAYIHESIKDMDSDLFVRIPRELINMYGEAATKEDMDRIAQILCRSCKVLEERGLADAIIYNGRNPLARRLADWWDKHKAEDARQAALQEKANAVDQIVTRLFGDKGFVKIVHGKVNVYLTLAYRQINISDEQFMDLYNIMTEAKNDQAQTTPQD